MSICDTSSTHGIMTPDVVCSSLYSKSVRFYSRIRESSYVLGYQIEFRLFTPDLKVYLLIPAMLSPLKACIAYHEALLS